MLEKTSSIGVDFLGTVPNLWSMASPNIIELSSANFQSKVLSASGTVLVDFWAEWCGPCKMIAPLLDQIADAHVGKVTIGKVDVDKNPDLASQYNIRAIPTLIIFQGGQVKEQIVGMTSRAALEQKLGLL
jgi:thioredoxin 1